MKKKIEFFSLLKNDSSEIVIQFSMDKIIYNNNDQLKQSVHVNYFDCIKLNKFVGKFHKILTAWKRFSEIAFTVQLP